MARLTGKGRAAERLVAFGFKKRRDRLFYLGLRRVKKKNGKEEQKDGLVQTQGPSLLQPLFLLFHVAHLGFLKCFIYFMTIALVILH